MFGGKGGCARQVHRSLPELQRGSIGEEYAFSRGAAEAVRTGIGAGD